MVARWWTLHPPYRPVRFAESRFAFSNARSASRGSCGRRVWTLTPSYPRVPGRVVPRDACVRSPRRARRCWRCEATPSPSTGRAPFGGRVSAALEPRQLCRRQQEARAAVYAQELVVGEVWSRQHGRDSFPREGRPAPDICRRTGDRGGWGGVLVVERRVTRAPRAPRTGSRSDARCPGCAPPSTWVESPSA